MVEQLLLVVWDEAVPVQEGTVTQQRCMHSSPLQWDTMLAMAMGKLQSQFIILISHI